MNLLCIQKLLAANFVRILSVFFVAPLLQICNADFPAPTKIIGIFKHENCAPAVAASLAVELFNANRQKSLHFSYESIQEDATCKLSDVEIIRKLNNSVIVTGDPLICERLSKILIDVSSFLVCYGTPTEKTFESIEDGSNLYLSRPDPEAVVHCLFKLMKLIIDEQNISSTASLVFNDGHPYRHTIGEWLILNLRTTYDLFDETFNVVSLSNEHHVESLSNKILEASFINAVLHENEARNLLCHFYHNKYSNENRTLIFVGLSQNHWLRSDDNLNDFDDTTSFTCDSQNEMNGQSQVSCTPQDLRKSAEGHLLLEYPAPSWISPKDESWNISLVKSDLRQRLQTTRTTVDYDEAPLAFDSVWAILRAIDRTFRREGQVGGESVGRALISKPFTGLTGGTFSFVKYRNGKGGCVRNIADATIIIKRFENGDYVPIGKHFNANNSFQWSHHLFSNGGRHTWKPTRPECPPNLSNTVQSWRYGWVLLLSVTSLLLTDSLPRRVSRCFE